MGDIPMDIAIRLARLQQRVFRCIEDELNEDGHHKSYEGAIDVTLCLPNIFEHEQGPIWVIELHCYVLPLSGRHQSWKANTLTEALAKAEQEIGKLCDPYEMRRFEKRLECVDDTDELDGCKVYANPRTQEKGTKEPPF